MVGEWFSPAELATAGLPGLPDERAIRIRAEAEWRDPAREGTHWRVRAGRGGGYEYHIAVLPRAAQVMLAMAAAPEPAAAAQLARGEAWRWYERLPTKKQAEARRRAEALDAIELLMRSGLDREVAVLEIARASKACRATVYNWLRLVAGVDRCDWLPALAPRHAGRQAEVECPPEAWEALKALYLRPEAPDFADCHRHLERMAAERGWALPSARTLQRRLEAMPEELRVLARRGVEALKRLYPAQERLRDHFHALQAVNADGHKWDVFVRWPDGTVGRPQMVAIQDLFSGMILAWRVDKTANKEAVRLALGDMIETWGIPSMCWLDNGRDFASKWITGGTPNRYRFKVTDEEPSGILPDLGVAVHWTTPYAGQSKPIERAFRDLAHGLAKHPRFAGAYVGHKPDAKPENYASRAVPLDVFIATIAEGIAEHNARPGRDTRVCGRTLSFEQAFRRSYEAAGTVITQATPEQRRLWLLAAEAIRVDRDGTVTLLGNRFYGEFLGAYRGQRVTVRFDPQALQEPAHIYRTDGGYLGQVQCVAAVGFDDVDAAREHARLRKGWMKSRRAMLAAELSLSIGDVADMLAKAPDPAPPPEAKVVRPLFRGNAALQAQPDDDELPEAERLFLDFTRMRRGAGLTVIESDD